MDTEPQTTDSLLRQVVNLAAQRDVEDPALLLDVIATLLSRAGYADRVDAM